mmetsp:Transcript_18232/g.32928  ORF Transcript_18232/g.32928 Transcript_18232/m.32928 type:complete len:149 (+) Transcript_18232:89-535(+)
MHFNLFIAGTHLTFQCSAKGSSLIWIYSLGWLRALKVFRDQGLHLWNARRATDLDNIINLRLVDIYISDDPGDRPKCLLEQILIQFFKASSCESFGNVKSFGQIIDLKANLLLRYRALLARSTSLRNFCYARLSPLVSTLLFFFILLM